MNLCHRSSRRCNVPKKFQLVDMKKSELIPCNLIFADDSFCITTIFDQELKVCLKDIEEIRLGHQTDNWLKFLTILKKSNRSYYESNQTKIKDSFSIILPRPDPFLYDTYDFVATDELDPKFIDELKAKVTESKQNSKIVDHQIMIEKFFHNYIVKQKDLVRVDESRNEDQKILDRNKAIDRMEKFVKRIELKLKRHHLESIITEDLWLSDKAILIDLLDQLDSRPYFNFLFSKYAIPNSEKMSYENLASFFAEEQDEQPNEEQVKQFISKYADIVDDRTEERFLSRQAFFRLIESKDEFELFNEEQNKICQDMEQPLNHYFISSSHNTYLTGNQLTSQSTCEMYRQVLLAGCRCIEIDVWDDGKNDVLVYHGHTITSRIRLEDVLITINESAFLNSDYPVIISLENNCKEHDNHRKISMWMRLIFQEKLFDGPVDNERFPSPNKLRNKIFVKCSKNEPFIDDSFEVIDHRYISFRFFEIEYTNISKQRKRLLIEKIRENKRRKFERLQSNEPIVDDVDEDDEKYVKQLRRKIKVRRKEQSTESRLMPVVFNDDFDVASSSPPSSRWGGLLRHNSSRRKSQRNPHSPDAKWDESLSELINYFETKKFLSIEKCLEEFEFYQMISRNENSSKELINNNYEDYLKFTCSNMVRVYPSGLRQNSSNYYPLDHWDVGAQMVALNYQTFSLPMFLNNALFALNGRCGYVLKPQYLRDQQEYSEKPLNPRKLKIKILCGQFWNHFDLKKINLKIVIRVYCGSRIFRQSTQAVNNGFNPVWDETFEFQLDKPDLSFVHFTLTNENRFLANYLISLQAMRKGLRHVPLFDAQYRPIDFTRLTIHTE